MMLRTDRQQNSVSFLEAETFFRVGELGRLAPRLSPAIDDYRDSREPNNDM